MKGYIHLIFFFFDASACVTTTVCIFTFIMIVETLSSPTYHPPTPNRWKPRAAKRAPSSLQPETRPSG